MTRQELTNVLLPAIIRGGADRATADRIVAMKSTSELGILYAQFIRQGRIEPPKPTVTHADVDQAAREADLELDTIRERHREALSRSRAERNADAIMFKLRQDEADLPRRKAESEAALARDKAAFDEAAKVLKFGKNQANFNLCRQVLGEGNVTPYGISQAISSKTISLSPMTPEDEQQLQAEQIEAHNKRLLSMNPMELRQEMIREQQQRAIMTHKQETVRVLAAQKQADAGRYPDLPLVNSDGVKLNSRFFRRASAAEIRNYIRRYGNAQVTDAIRNRV